MRMSPADLLSYTCLIAVCISRVGSMRKMCPTHRSLVALIALIIQKVFVSSVASAFIDLPVMWCSIWLFAPFSALIVSSFSFHPSAPYTMTLQTHIPSVGGKVLHAIDFFSHANILRSHATRMRSDLSYLSELMCKKMMIACERMFFRTRTSDFRMQLGDFRTSAFRIMHFHMRTFACEPHATLQNFACKRAFFAPERQILHAIFVNATRMRAFGFSHVKRHFSHQNVIFYM